MNWYYRLKSNGSGQSLEDYKDLSNVFLVSREGPNRSMQFASFTTIYEFMEYYMYVDPDERVYYETILGHKQQKLYFDVDISTEDSPDDIHEISLELVQQLKDSILEVVEGSEDTNIMIFNSSRVGKISYHVVLDRFKFENNKSLSIIYDRVIENMDPDYHKYMDKLYKSIQQFRILGSHKAGKDNVKRLDPELSTWKPSRSTNRDREILIASMVTVTNSCKYYYVELPEETTHENKEIHLSEENLTSLYSIIDQLTCYKISKENSNLISLKREYAAHCPICDRFHENEGAFVVVSPDYTVNLYCFRDEQKKPYKIGKLESELMKQSAKYLVNIAVKDNEPEETERTSPIHVKPKPVTTVRDIMIETYNTPMTTKGEGKSILSSSQQKVIGINKHGRIRLKK